MKLTLSILSLAIIATTFASPGSNWIVATQPAPVIQSYFWDYTEGQSVVTNMRQSSVSGNTTNRIHDLDYGTNGTLYAAGKFGNAQTNQFFEGAYIVNPGTGLMSQIASFGLMAEGDMSFDPLLNRLVVIGKGAGITSAYQVDLANANAVSTLWTSTAFDDVSGVAFDSLGNGFLVDSHVNTGGVSELFSFNNSGANSIGSLGIGLGPALGMDFDGNDQLHLLGISGNLYHVNGLSPALVDNISNPLGHQYTGLAYAPVPEPSTMAALAVAGIGFLRRRRRVSR
ncbi:MAG: PEP-CTERM sorting domain-containing protein [Fimbriimonadaceae bacterium]